MKRFTFINKEGEVLKLNNTRYVDQLDNSSNPWSGSRNKLIKRLKDEYGLTELQYVNLVMRGDENSYKICENPECENILNEYLPYKTRMNKTCNSSCKFSKIQKDLSSKGLHGAQLETSKLRDNSVIYKASKGKILTYGPNRSGVLYLTHYKDKIKFGVTTDINKRKQSFMEKGSTGFYENIHIIKRDKLSVLSEVEYDIKMTIDPLKITGNSEMIQWSQLKQLINIIKKY
jgi:hypothetical protein